MLVLRRCRFIVGQNQGHIHHKNGVQVWDFLKNPEGNTTRKFTLCFQQLKYVLSIQFITICLVTLTFDLSAAEPDLERAWTEPSAGACWSFTIEQSVGHVTKTPQQQSEASWNTYQVSVEGLKARGGSMDLVLLRDTQLDPVAALCCFPELQQTHHSDHSSSGGATSRSSLTTHLQLLVQTKSWTGAGLRPTCLHPDSYSRTDLCSRETLNLILAKLSRTSSFHQRQTCQTAAFQPQLQEPLTEDQQRHLTKTTQVPQTRSNESL